MNELLPKLQECSTWIGEFAGVNYEIKRWEAYRFDKDYGFKRNWAYYLYIHLDRLKPEEAEANWLPPRKWGMRNQRVGYDYEESPLGQLRWHGGATFYRKHGGIDEIPRVVQVGCDFQHLYDRERGCDYSLEDVRGEALETIKEFRRAYPDYKFWCLWDGKLHPPAEVVVNEQTGAYKCVNCKGEK